MTMWLISLLCMIYLFSAIHANIYVYRTEDHPFTEYHDCIKYRENLYCIRPGQPIRLQRDPANHHCYHNGILHSFTSLQLKNISAYTILHKWRSSIEKAEDYARFLRLDLNDDGYLCECRDRQTFGKMCEYRLVEGESLGKALEKRNSLREKNPWLVQLYGDIVCYETLKCNSGILCLDWRNICDGFQQCMSGIDEENCDKLEFNECEPDEYRCKNGMCIPDEYFVDGSQDCMDSSDETAYNTFHSCNYPDRSHECDDHVCPSLKFACGSGYCIDDRFTFQHNPDFNAMCSDYREQYHICETGAERMWTLPNGRCYGLKDYALAKNVEAIDLCSYYLKCALSEGLEKHCPCRKPADCAILLQKSCPSSLVQYPQGGYPVAYTFYYYNISDYLTQKTPSLIVFNGTIKCRGYLIDFLFEKKYEIEFDHPTLETWLCRHLLSTKEVENYPRYEEYCAHESQTFNNQSYNAVDACNDWRQCFSAYRMIDGYSDCVDQRDENRSMFELKFCAKIQKYRFQCSQEEKTCLLVGNIGDNVYDCDNMSDELWMSTDRASARFDCLGKSVTDCTLLRQYLEDSWKPGSRELLKSQNQIPFRAYCDTFWSLSSRKDEETAMCQRGWKCPADRWQCRTGQCIKSEWVLDLEWDCTDGSDEEALFMMNTSIPARNLHLRRRSELQSKFRALYRYQPFAQVCNISTEYSCIRVNVTDPWINATDQRPCIDLSKIGDGKIDCLGAIDERNTLEHCDNPSMLGYYYFCPSTRTCISYTDHCQTRCPNLSDDAAWCDRPYHQASCPEKTPFMCFNGSCSEKKACDKGIPLCTHSEDRYMCNPLEYTRTFYHRDDKSFDVGSDLPILDLLPFPDDIAVEEINSEEVAHERTTEMRSIRTPSSIISYQCNRGFGVQWYNGSTICFCPEQYYGDKCQYHQDRITVLLSVDFSQSIYEGVADASLLMKFLVVFLFKESILQVHEFQLRPSLSFGSRAKYLFYLLASRSKESLDEKKKRYFNRSSIIHEHPYAVRIESYEVNRDESIRWIATWFYPIYFDYLPVHRVVKILRFSQISNGIDPCTRQERHGNEECRTILNHPNKCLCLCKNGYTGMNCSMLDQNCARNHCAPKALCKPDYQSSLHGNQNPFCLCPQHQFGARCDLFHDGCESNPCQNNGTCLTRDKINQFDCLCNNLYEGNVCQQRKSRNILYVNQTIPHIAAVVQYLKIDMRYLVLTLIDQQLYRQLPSTLEYYHEITTMPQLVLIKVYSSYPKILSSQAYIFMLFLRIERGSVIATTGLSENNSCLPVAQLFSKTEGKTISIEERKRIFL